MLERLICAVFGHRYVVERVLNHGAKKIGCTLCDRSWAMHDGTRSFVPWNGEFEMLYAKDGVLAQCVVLGHQVVALRAELAALKQQAPARLEWDLDAEAIKFLAETLQASIQNDYGDEPTPITLRVGNIEYDDGTIKYGLLVLDTDYPEEGASLLAESPPPQPSGKGE